MFLRLLQLPLAMMLAFGAASGVHAQTATVDSDRTMLPVVNNDSGKVEWVLVLEPTGETSSGARWRFGSNSLTAAFGLQSGDSLGLLCDRKTGIASALGNLAEHCMLAAMGDNPAGSSRRASASASLGNVAGKLGINVGSGRDRLPAWLAPNYRGVGVEQNDLTVFAQKNIGNTGVVSIGGTMARARLIPAGEMPAMTDRWNSKSLSIGGGIGAFRANIVGRVVDVPGQPEQWQGLGIGLTWRTPWSGKLTVGAENVVTRGRNPFSPISGADEDEGTVPYVRYQQDL